MAWQVLYKARDGTSFMTGVSSAKSGLHPYRAAEICIGAIPDKGVKFFACWPFQLRRSATCQAQLSVRVDTFQAVKERPRPWLGTQAMNQGRRGQGNRKWWSSR